MNTETPDTSEQPRTREELLARVDDGWRPFRDAVRAIGRARMDEMTAAGWMFRDLLAHCAAWEELTSRRLRALRESGGREQPPPGVDVDVFNAQVADSHRLVGPEALLDELEASHRLLREEIGRLTDEQVVANDSWVVAVVAGNSYGHYLEHAAELGMTQ
ncbi:MAG: maleylpyruvate isomerase N-terminal domain-containing protein [Candidatus Limnocylindria bacterium]